MKAEKIEFSKEGLFIDGKKYGLHITKVEIESLYVIKVYVHKFITQEYEEIIKQEGFEDYNNPYDLIQYENIKIVEE